MNESRGEDEHEMISRASGSSFRNLNASDEVYLSSATRGDWERVASCCVYRAKGKICQRYRLTPSTVGRLNGVTWFSRERIRTGCIFKGLKRYMSCSTHLQSPISQVLPRHSTREC